MNFHYFDIIQIIIFLILIFISYRLYLNNKWKTLGGLWIVCLIWFFNVPVVTENNQSRVLFTSQPQELPEKVGVEKQDFKKLQEDELRVLRKENKETEEKL